MSHNPTMIKASTSSGAIINRPTPKGRADRNWTDRAFFFQPKKNQTAPVSIHAAKERSKTPASKIKEPGAAILRSAIVVGGQIKSLHFCAPAALRFSFSNDRIRTAAVELSGVSAVT